MVDSRSSCSRRQISMPSFDFSQLGLAGILAQYDLVVPPNQRDYSWTTKEVTTLFQDFARAISDDDPTYFVGTIVTIPRDGRALEVVDGQQRLATSAINARRDPQLPRGPRSEDRPVGRIPVPDSHRSPHPARASLVCNSTWTTTTTSVRA